MSTGNDITVTIPASRFNAFTSAIRGFNKRTKAINKHRKNSDLKTVERFPASHHGTSVVVCVHVKDRSKVLWQELTDLVDGFRANAKSTVESTVKPTVKKTVKSAYGVYVDCSNESDAIAIKAALILLGRKAEIRIA